MNVIARSQLLKRLAACGLALVILTRATPALAMQHLVAPGDDWQALEKKLRPGDEVILMPGRHRPASFERLVGTVERPITIRGLDPNQPATIYALRQGVEIKVASNLILKDFTISDATINGLCIGIQKTNVPSAPVLPKADGKPDLKPEPKPAPNPAPAASQPAVASGLVQLRNLTINKTGPAGQRHGIVISNYDNVRIDNCTIQGWGGSAIEVIACHDVTIDRCTLRGLKDHRQLQGIRVRAQSERVSITNCRMENAGERVVCIGGSSEPLEMDLPTSSPPQTPSPNEIAPQSTAGMLFEAGRVQVEHCVIIGGLCAVAIINADDCAVRNNTIVRPRRTAMTILAEQTDFRFSAGKRNIFGLNVIVWEPGDLKRFAEIGDKIDTDSFVMEQNLWWSTETPEQQKKLGAFPGKNPAPQLMNVDPKMDGKYRALDPAARDFGA